MAHNVESRINTPSAELRDLLDSAERQLPTLDAATLVDYLLRLDRIEALFAELEADHIERNSSADQALRSELVRWADLQKQLERRSNQLVKVARASGGFGALRAQHPASDGAWWRLDELVAAKQRKQMRSLLRTLVVTAVLLLASVLAYQTWFAPDPETVALVNALSTIERYVDEQEWALALSAAEEAIQTAQANVEVLVWAAVISERLGDADRAARYREQAKALLAGQELQFHVLLGTDRFRAGDLDGATEAVNTALALQPEEPQAHFLLGNIAEARGDIFAALEAFDRAATLADSDNPQLTVISKMRYGFLLQQLQAIPDLDTGETPPASPEEAAESTPPATQ
jgi:tetratricopeptide (TPR) repeat protein